MARKNTPKGAYPQGLKAVKRGGPGVKLTSVADHHLITTPPTKPGGLPSQRYYGGRGPA